MKGSLCCHPKIAHAALYRDRAVRGKKKNAPRGTTEEHVLLRFVGQVADRLQPWQPKTETPHGTQTTVGMSLSLFILSACLPICSNIASMSAKFSLPLSL